MGCGTLAGLGLALAGTGTQMYANNRTQNAENQAASSELARQEQFQNQARNVFNQNLQNSTPQTAGQQQQQGQQQFLGASKQAQLPSLGLTATDPTQANAVSGAGQDALNQLGQQSNAQLQGYSNVPLQQGLGNLQTQNQLGAISGNASDWASILPLQLQQASQSQAGLSALGSLLGTAGQVVGLSGLGSAPAQTMTPWSQVGNYPGTAQMLGGVANQNAGNWLQTYLNGGQLPFGVQ
jgi:hypothetical protein